MPREQGDIFKSFTQRRQADRHNIQAIEQVFAEQPLADLVAQIAVRCSHDSHIGLDGLAPTHRGELTFLQNAQQAGLRFWRHIADFIQEQRAAGGLFKPANAAIERTSECAAFMAEKLGFDQFTRNGCHVDGHKRPRAALAVIMQSAGDQFLPRAAFPGDHHRQVRGGEARHRAIDFLHGGRTADKG